MVVLHTNTENRMVFTLDEFETTENTKYILDMKNTLTGVDYNDIELIDVSEYTERYNEFIVHMNTLDGELHITEDTVLDENYLYVIDGDIIVDEGVTLEIPNSTWLIQNSDYDIIDYGEIVNYGHILVTPTVNENTYYLNSSDYKSITGDNVTVLLNLRPAFYDYTIYSEDKSEVLEIGRILIKDPDEENTVYENTEEPQTYIYKK